MSANTLLLRLEGPMQSWGNNESKFVIRRTAQAPTKSGVIGMLCAALGVSRVEAPDKWLPELNNLCMGVRIDRAGIRWWDYHTIGAGMEMRTAGKRKEEAHRYDAMLTRREYLCDASFLVALQGNPDVVAKVEDALRNPIWTLYLGRKCCPPSRPILQPDHASGAFEDLETALASVPYVKRFGGDDLPEILSGLIEWRPSPGEPEAPDDAEVWYDVPLTFEPPSHGPRLVVRGGFTVGPGGQVAAAPEPFQKSTPPPVRPRADYTNSAYKKIRDERMSDKYDHRLCVFCKAPATTVQHITYRHAGGNERIEELRSLCRLCHDAVTMIEYGLNMGMDRINPEETRWRDLLLQKRDEIIRFRSLETRRRHLSPEEVE